MTTVDRDPFIAGVAATIDRFGLLPAGARVVVAFSGGPDSMALLAALAALAPERRYTLVAAHLDHGLRAESAADARFAEEQARRFGVDFVSQRRDVAGLARRWRTSLEAAGRRARYRFLQETAAGRSCPYIAVGHHRDDQVETVLLNLLAGAGPDGVAGMRPRRGAVVRPLLEQRRADILAFLRRRGLTYRIDASNEDFIFTRNRIRGELLPLLRRAYNPRIDDALWRLSRLAADEVDYLEDQAARLLQAARMPLPGGVWIECRALRQAPPALRRRVIRQAFWEAAAGTAGTVSDAGAPGAWGESVPVEAGGLRQGSLTMRHVEAVEELLGLSTGALDLPRGVRVAVQQGRLCFRRVHHAGPPAAGPVGPGGGAGLPSRRLPVPGRVPWDEPWSGIAAEVLDGGPPDPADLRRPGHAYLDYDRLGAPGALHVRTWQPGDRMRPLGAPGSRKLQDLFVDRKVPRELRRRVPVVTLGDTILWVPGAAVADPFRVSSASRRLLHLYLEGAEPEVLR